MQKKRRSKSSIIAVIVVAVVMIAMMVFWRQYESKHEGELRSSLLTTAVPDALPEGTTANLEPTKTKPRRVIPDEPEKILAMAEEAFADEGYFEPNDSFKGFHVYSLLKKCLDCNGDPDKVEEIAKRLKERSSKTYGKWYIERDLLVDLDESIKKSKEQI